MRFLVALLFIFSVPIHGEVTHTDVEQALKTVTTNTYYPDQYRITRIGMEDPVGVLWNHKREICEVLVSAKHLSSIELMFNYQPKMPMLEGFIAHELSHCVELKELDAVGGYSEMRKLLMNPDTRFASELLADIVAIMYWKRFTRTTPCGTSLLY